MSSVLDDLPRLSSLFAASGLASLELTGPPGRVLLRRDPPATSPGEEAALGEPVAGGGHIAVLSAGVGTLLLAHPLHARPLVGEGEEVRAGQPLALLQVGPLLRPVLAPRAGTLAAIRRAEGDLVGFGDPLFDILPWEADPCAST